MGFPNPYRSSFGVAKVDNRLIIVGGHQGVYHDYQKANWSRTVQSVRLDGTDQQALPDFPETVQGVRAVADGKDVIAFGGFIYDAALDVGLKKITFNWFARSISDVRVLSAGADHWETILRMPRQRSSNIAEVVDGKVYLLGGWDGTTELKTGLSVNVDTSGRFHNTVDIFDLKSRQFIPNMIRFPDPLRRAFSSTVLDGKIIMAGGITPDYGVPGVAPLNTVTMFDPKTGGFSDTMYPPLKRKVFSPSICAVGDSLVMLGGMDENYGASDEVWVYRKGAGDWVPNKTALKGADTFMETFAIDDKSILVIGGHNIASNGLPMGIWEVLAI